MVYLILADDDARDVAEELKDVTAKCYEIGCALRIYQREMDKLEGLCRHEPVKALEKVIGHYLKQNYNTIKHGHPSWRKIVAAVSNSMGGCNHALAKKIAQNHQGTGVMYYYCVFLHSYRASLGGGGGHSPLLKRFFPSWICPHYYCRC